MLTDRELQSLRNLGNESEMAADEIAELRAWADQNAATRVAAERERIYGHIRGAMAHADAGHDDIAWRLLASLVGSAAAGPVDREVSPVAWMIEHPGRYAALSLDGYYAACMRGNGYTTHDLFTRAQLDASVSAERERHADALRCALEALDYCIDDSAELLDKQMLEWGRYSRGRQAAMVAALERHRAVAARLREMLAA